LLSAVVCHDNVPNDFLLCTTIPMPKGNTDRAVSGNYRGITLSSVFGRLIDLLILQRYSDVGLLVIYNSVLKPNDPQQCAQWY